MVKKYYDIIKLIKSTFIYRNISLFNLDYVFLDRKIYQLFNLHLLNTGNSRLYNVCSNSRVKNDQYQKSILDNIKKLADILIDENRDKEAVYSYFCRYQIHNSQSFAQV